MGHEFLKVVYKKIDKCKFLKQSKILNLNREKITKKLKTSYGPKITPLPK